MVAMAFVVKEFMKGGKRRIWSAEEKRVIYLQA